MQKVASLWIVLNYKLYWRSPSSRVILDARLWRFEGQSRRPVKAATKADYAFAVFERAAVK